MKALAKVLKELKEKDIGSSFRDLTLQIRPYFDDEDDALRSTAFVLFGILARLAKRKWKAYFADQVRKSWVTLLLHLQDPNPEVSMFIALLLSQFQPGWSMAASPESRRGHGSDPDRSLFLSVPGPCLPRTERPQLCLVQLLS
ncbi:carbohydrate kinase [Platysternon megacephalum]|uniref:Carbohydrate kinase n=1 Tax=Platysternon megacephalum TaxID=55544 RepID=A0A4D9DDY9_9SAUR|nr:carbohydrate kinase [Platysternon megacephalum]